MKGRKQKAREGKWNGSQASFGYEHDTENSTLIVIPEKAEIVRIIFDKFVHSDMGADSIANYLNQHGYSKKRVREHEVRHFARGLIRGILDNPVYIGKIAYGKSATEKVKGTRDQYRRVAQDDYLTADGNHEAIIDNDTWEAAQKKRKETGVKWNKTHSLEHEHILSGLLKCPICGTGMAGTVRRRKNKKSGEYKDDFYYRCLHRKKIDEELFCNFKLSLNREETNKAVEEVILKMTSSHGYSEAIAKKLGEKVDISALENEKEQYRAQLRQAVGAKNKLTAMLDKLDVEDKHYDRKYQDMQDRLDNLYDKISDIEDAIADIEEKISGVYGEHVTTEYLYQILKNFDKIYYEMTDPEKKEFMRNFVEAIEILPKRTGSGRILEHIDLRFPIYYEGSEGD